MRLRKKLILVTLLLGGIISGYISYLAWAAGYALTMLCSGRKEGTGGKVKSVIIPWRRYQLHLHHWLLTSVAAAISAISGFFLFTPELFYGFLSGILFQGIYCYGDWHKIVKRKQVPVEVRVS